jgi:hypothetical protein
MRTATWKGRIGRWIFGAIITLALVLFPASLFAGTIKLNWDPVSDPDLAGYKVYYGTSPGLYTQTAVIGSQAAAELTNLQDCRVYYLAVKAVDSNGNESVSFSNEISGLAAPVLTSVTQASAKQATANLNVTISGTNFDTQARPDFGPDILVNSYSTTSCNQMAANITITAAARVNQAPGLPRLLTIINQGGPRGSKSGVFTVQFNERRADIDASGRVIGRDFLYWRNAFPTVLGDPTYNVDADMNGDGQVDGADLALLALWHGTTFF